MSLCSYFNIQLIVENFLSQLILQNPICFFAYALISWKFFHARILIEEITLLKFFGDNYVEYQERVGTGLPFISGYKFNS